MFQTFMKGKENIIVAFIAKSVFSLTAESTEKCENIGLLVFANLHSEQFAILS